LGGHDKKMKVKSGTSMHHSEDLLDRFYVSIWGPAKTALLGGHMYIVSLIDNLSKHCWMYPMRQI